MSGKLIYDRTPVSDNEKCCLLCNNYFNAGGQSASADSTDTENTAISFAYKAFRTFDKHLSVAVKGESFCLPKKENYNPTFCTSCIVFAVRLIRIDEEMEEIKKRLKDFVNYLSLEILTAKGLSTFTYEDSINKQHYGHLQNGVEIAHNDSQTDINTVKPEPDDTDCQHSSEGDFEGDSFHPTEEDTKNVLSVNNNKTKHKVDCRASENEKLVKTNFKLEQLTDPFVKLIDINKHPVNKAIGATVETYRPTKRRSADAARKMLQNRIQKEYSSSDSEFERNDDNRQKNNEYELSGEDCEDSERDMYLPESEKSDDEEAVTADHFNTRKRNRRASQSSELTSKLARKSSTKSTNSSVRDRKIHKNFQCRECEATFSFTRQLDQHNEETGHVNEKTFKCKFCDKRYYRNVDLKCHAKEHPDNTKKFTCTLCNKHFTGFNADLRLEKHLKSHERISKLKDKKSFVCKVCDEDFALSKELIQHSETTGHINERKFSCSICSNSYFRNRDLKFHERLHTLKNMNSSKKSFVCQVCEADFTLSKELLDHSKTTGHKNERNFFCPICSKSFFRKVDLGYHIKLHGKKMRRDKKSFVCIVCKADFPFTKELVEHSETTGHKNEKKFLCSKCPSSYFRRVDLKCHLRTHLEAYECEFCNKTFKTALACKNHVARHTAGDVSNGEVLPEEGLYCDDPQCGKWFQCKKRLGLHIKKGHEPMREWHCTECPYISRKKSIFEIHLRTHTGERNFICEECGVSYATQGSLRVHRIKAHLGFRYSCLHCDKKFVSNSSRKAHQLIHKREQKTFKCTICKQEFLDKQELTTHQKTSHSNQEKRFKCSHCDARFTNGTNLKIHAKNVHGITPKPPKTFLK